MIDDLVKRLREYRIGCGIHCSAYDAREPLDECIEAADRIEKLEESLRKISQQNTLWGAICKAKHALGDFDRKALEDKQ